MGTMADLRTASSGLCWPLRMVLFLVISSAAAPSAAPSADQQELLRALDALVNEEDARKVLEPYMEALKQLDTTVVEKVVMKQWWNIATDIIAKSHLQGVDLSFAVRKAVRGIKEEADELLRTLNPKYGQAQQVAPAFQWAQNDTCIFLTVKFTVRWNAPGALEVTEPAVHMEGFKFNFTGLGKHSNNKYKYQLALKLFDNIMPTESTWNTASVGKLSVTLRKLWPRKWPRLLLDKKTKIGNMHVWMETQDRLNGDLGGMSTVSHSPPSCALTDKLYCSVTDSCKAKNKCDSCLGKTIPSEKLHICAGVPTQKGSIEFKDTDMDRHELGGLVKITKPKHDFESESFSVFWGQSSEKMAMPDGSSAYIGSAPAHKIDVNVNFPQNTKKPEGATHLLVFSQNAHGEYPTPGLTPLKDAYLPHEAPKGFSFNDEDGDRGEVKGDLVIEKYEKGESFDKYGLYFGKSATRKIDSSRKNNSAFIADIDKEQSTYFLGDSTRIPDQATHFLLFSKNEHGEHPTPSAIPIVDNRAPCEQYGADDCPVSLTMATSEQHTYVFTVARAKEEAGLTAYTLYWGRGPCDESGDRHLNGHLKYLPIEGSVDYELPASIDVPDGTTHVLAFAQNKHGESKFCVSQKFFVPGHKPPKQDL